MKKIISYSLYGGAKKYWYGMLCNVEQAKIIYPGWICRVYYDSSVPHDVIKELSTVDNVELVNMDGITEYFKMSWRFLAIDDDDVEIMICRDADSRLSWREKTCVDIFMESDKLLHSIRDNPNHPDIMGGMWGMKKNTFPNMITEIQNYNKGNFWQIDQNFLNQVVYPSCSGNIFVHDEFFNFESHRKNFPTKRLDKEFVGDVFDDKNIRHPEYYKKI